MAGQRPARMAKGHPHARHIQEVQRTRDALVQLIEGFQTGLGQGFGLFPREGVKAALLFLQVLYPLLRGLYHLKFFPRPFAKGEDVLYGVSVLPPELIDKVDALLDLVQLCVVGVVGVQTANEVCGNVLCGVIKVEQLARTGRQLSVELCRCVHSVGGFAQKVNSPRGLVAAGEQRVTLCDTVPDGGSIRQHFAAAFQRLLLPCRQAGIVDLLHLIAQQVDTALLFALVGYHGVQRLFDADQFPVDSIIRLIFSTVLGVSIQNALMTGRVQQAHGVVLTVDVDKPPAQLPQDGGSGRHPVDTAGALALGGDLTAEQQGLRALIACLFEAVENSRRHVLERGPDDSLGRAGAHEILGSAVAQNGVDGVDEDGFACARLTGQDVEALLKVDIGFLDNCNIFDLQAAQHSFTPAFISARYDGSVPNRWSLRPAPNGPR